MDAAGLALVLMRPLERLLAVGIGGISIYLGYRLFLALPEHSDSQGRIVLPGGVDVRLSRIGPGAFLALFGALVVGFALWRGVAVELPAGGATRDGSVEVAGTQALPAVPPPPLAVVYSGAGVAPQARRPDDTATLARLRNDLADLNALTPQALAALPESLRTNTELVLPRAKLALLAQAWAPDWGDAAAFEAWVLAGAIGAPPAGLERAAGLFRHGLPAGSTP